MKTFGQPFTPLFGRRPALGDRGHCAQAVQCPGSQGCLCRREVERELARQQRGAR